MMGDINECFSYFISQMRADADISFIKTDMEYQELECYLMNHKEKYLSIINRLPPEDCTFLHHYIEQRNHQIACANDTLYLAGYYDCIKLLKTLNILS
ncbi:hypothetical protein HZI73_01170 [Vallitalea pronyensis]|uniref:Uncharacterized protein n=1 Tax=Vallitalea pronyensis TaxID=1348613 RepID=A0A8J8MG27_9FIRM|nr:hypothetical protein [Vallitalea pronyensis]QUI20990.1 hypothetical protein HZI73_01170 [Vallitalea pronyensis]